MKYQFSAQVNYHKFVDFVCLTNVVNLTDFAVELVDSANFLRAFHFHVDKISHFHCHIMHGVHSVHFVFDFQSNHVSTNN